MAPNGHVVIELVTAVLTVIPDNPRLDALASAAEKRIEAALCPWTRCSYLAGFRLFLAFIVHMNISVASSLQTVLVYLEFLVQNNLKAVSLRNHLSILKYYFSLFGWSTSVFNERKVQLFVKSVQINAKLQVKVKGIFKVELLQRLVTSVMRFTNAEVYRALFLVSFFGFFRLASLVSNLSAEFDVTRFPVLGDVIWGAPGAHIVMTCSKTMQKAGAMQVVQLPQLLDSILCPVKALKVMIKAIPRDKVSPLFLVRTKSVVAVLTASKARYFFRMVIVSLGLNPRHFTFHAFRHSGASLAFNHDVKLDHIKQHGHWRSESVWTYLNSTPKAAATIPLTFQDIIPTS